MKPEQQIKRDHLFLGNLFAGHNQRQLTLFADRTPAKQHHNTAEPTAKNIPTTKKIPTK